MADEENEEDWKYFLSMLKASCNYLTEKHPSTRWAPYKLFIFVSNVDKSIIQFQLRENFPDNLHSYSTEKIVSHVSQKHGKDAGSCAKHIAMTFSVRQESSWYERLKKLQLYSKPQ